MKPGHPCCLCWVGPEQRTMMLTRPTPPPPQSSQPLPVSQVLESAEQACEGSCGNAGPWFPHLSDGIPNTSDLLRVVRGWKELIHLACLAPGPGGGTEAQSQAFSPSPSAKPESDLGDAEVSSVYSLHADRWGQLNTAAPISLRTSACSQGLCLDSC